MALRMAQLCVCVIGFRCRPPRGKKVDSLAEIRWPKVTAHSTQTPHEGVFVAGSRNGVYYTINYIM
jgi:hypothetical protein